MNREQEERNQNLDLLRIVAMFCIVSMHYFGWGGLAGAPNTPTLNMAFGGGLAVATNCGVNCFYLISGFFIKQEETLEECRKRIIKVWVPTLFYSVLIPNLLFLLGKISLSSKQIVMTFFPILSNQYWFTTCFLAMTALLPFIAVMFKNLDDSKITRLMIIMIIIDSIQPILGYNAFSNIGYGIVHAFTMYTIGYTIRRRNWRLRSFVTIPVFIACVGIIGLITIVSIKITGDRNRTIADYNSILMIIQSVAFFMFFLNLKVSIKFSKLSPYIFGIYLLNDNQYARKVLWLNIFHCDDFYSSKYMPIHYLITVIVFYVCAFTIEWIRINALKLLRKIRGQLVCKI